MIVKPPAIPLRPGHALGEIIRNEPKEKIMDYLEWHSVVDPKGRYLPYDQFRHRLAPGVKADLAWGLLKESRRKVRSFLLQVGEDIEPCSFVLTPTIQKAMSVVDRNTTNAVLEAMSDKIGERENFNYLLNDLIEDEAISSSQLEGAATTTLVAREMLKRQRKPRTPDEKMIIGNFKMMNFAWEKRHEPLSTDLILELHQLGVEDIDDDKYTPGVFRKTDDVYIADSDGEIVHTPPIAINIEERLNKVVAWVNECHDDAESRGYIHPLVKAVSLHFSIGYEHPFRDGNGRVARSLFYWYMFKSEYAAFRYIAISTLLKKAPSKYGKSYLYTETDDMDLTYFIDHQCAIILRAIKSFKDSYKKTLSEKEEFDLWMYKSGLFGKLSERQKAVFLAAKHGLDFVFTASSVKSNLGCSYNTASSVLKGLSDLGLFTRSKEGREWVYQMVDPQILRNK